MHRVVSLHAQEHQEVKSEKDELTGKLSDEVIEIFINLRDLAESIVIIIVCLSTRTNHIDVPFDVTGCSRCDWLLDWSGEKFIQSSGRPAS